MWYETWSLPSFLLLGSFFTSNPTPAKISARESMPAEPVPPRNLLVEREQAGQHAGRDSHHRGVRAHHNRPPLLHASVLREDAARREADRRRDAERGKAARGCAVLRDEQLREQQACPRGGGGEAEEEPRLRSCSELHSPRRRRRRRRRSAGLGQLLRAGGDVAVVSVSCQGGAGASDL